MANYAEYDLDKSKSYHNIFTGIGVNLRIFGIHDCFGNH